MSTVETLNLKVGGMSCMGCVNSVKRLVEALPGIQCVEVDLTGGMASVTYDSSQLAPATIRETIRDGGYSVAD